MGPAIGLVARGGETPNIGVFGVVLVVFGCETTESVEFAVFSMVDGAGAFGAGVGTEQNHENRKRLATEKEIHTRIVTAFFWKVFLKR